MLGEEESPQHGLLGMQALPGCRSPHRVTQPRPVVASSLPVRSSNANMVGLLFRNAPG
jgi:hypothetical protein